MPTSTRRQAHAHRDDEDMEGVDETNTSEVTDTHASPTDEQIAAAIVASQKRSPGEADEEVSEEGKSLLANATYPTAIANNRPQKTSTSSPSRPPA